jgi:hypothetical protein
MGDFVNTLESLGFILGTSFASGLNLYATMGAAGLLQRLGLVESMRWRRSDDRPASSGRATAGNPLPVWPEGTREGKKTEQKNAAHEDSRWRPDNATPQIRDEQMTRQHAAWRPVWAADRLRRSLPTIPAGMVRV